MQNDNAIKPHGIIERGTLFQRDKLRKIMKDNMGLRYRRKKLKRKFIPG
jgi:hypothetical protein